MKYDFTTILDRRGMDSIAVDTPLGKTPPVGFSPVCPQGVDVIPMWVADMSFPVAPPVMEAIARRVQHPSFGYFRPTKAYYDAIINWQSARHGVQGLLPEHIGYENGVLGGVVSAADILCSPGDKILLHSPTYIGFTNSLTNNGYQLIHSPLVRDAEGVWRMDIQDMERKLVQHRIHTAIMCSPFNPCGRVWERWELEQAMELYKKYDVYVISDEIWADLTLGSHRHIPTQSVSEDARRRTIALYAPSKTFSLAGLVGSYHIIYDDRLRHRLDKHSSLTHYNSMNVLSMHALIGAYSPEGHEWVDELRQVLTENVDYACAFIRDRFPGVELYKPQGTYMLFLDCTRWCEEHGMTIEELLKAGWEVGVAWQDGRLFHGPCHIRMNLALPMSRLQEAFDRLDRHVFHRK